MESFFETVFYIFLTLGAFICTLAGFPACFYFVGTLLLGIILYVAPEIGFFFIMTIYLSFQFENFE